MRGFDRTRTPVQRTAGRGFCGSSLCPGASREQIQWIPPTELLLSAETVRQTEHLLVAPARRGTSNPVLHSEHTFQGRAPAGRPGPARYSSAVWGGLPPGDHAVDWTSSTQRCDSVCPRYLHRPSGQEACGSVETGSAESTAEHRCHPSGIRPREFCLVGPEGSASNPWPVQ